MLRAGLEETLERAAARTEPPPPQVVRHMFAAFADLGALEPHVIETAGLSAEAVLAQLRRRRPAGDSRLDVASLARTSG